MNTVARIRWGRILLGALFIELTMFAIFIPLQTVSADAAYWAVPILGMLTAFVFGRWAAAPAAGRFVLHGALTAAAASLMWLTMVLVSGGLAITPLLYHVVNVVRVAAGAAGGAWARRAAETARPAVAAR